MQKIYDAAWYGMAPKWFTICSMTVYSLPQLLGWTFYLIRCKEGFEIQYILYQINLQPSEENPSKSLDTTRYITSLLVLRY